MSRAYSKAITFEFLNLQRVEPYSSHRLPSPFDAVECEERPKQGSIPI